MSIPRRKFLSTSIAATGAAFASSLGIPVSPYKVSTRYGNPEDIGKVPLSISSGSKTPGVPLSFPTSVQMLSGAPLGGIGTGFIEIRADGCFYEWQIFNSGPWGRNARSTTATPRTGPQYLRFLLRTKKVSDKTAQIRKLYLRPDENDLYTLPYAQDIESIDYCSWYPMTSLFYNDNSIPVRVSAQMFSPMIPGNARISGTPGFHAIFTLENTSNEAVDVLLTGFLDNPLASALTERRLTNTLFRDNNVTGIYLNTEAVTDFPSGIGNLCFSVTGGDHSFVTGTFQEYLQAESCRWDNRRINYMLLNLLNDIQKNGRLPNTTCSADPGLSLLTNDQIDALSVDGVMEKIKELSSDALLACVFDDAKTANPENFQNIGKNLLKEVRANLIDRRNRLKWGTGALASSIRLGPGEKADIRFTLSWYFPHHLTVQGKELGHMYSNWFSSAKEVNQFMCSGFNSHRSASESFARTLADTSLGNEMAFSWAGQLSTAVFNTWWTKDGRYAMWEGLGCCGLSTTDVDYQGSFPITALFPELKLSQMRRIIAHQDASGRVPHNYSGDVDQVDRDFSRVDMNPQFVMMVYRDYLWTADKDYLNFMWNYIVKAMAFTESLDTNGDSLPDRDTGLQTYDQWHMRGTPSYIASLWIGALRCAILLANDLMKTDEAKHWSDLLKKASDSYDKILFNGQYYSLWVDGDERDELCMTDQVSGEWFCSILGLPTTIKKENFKNALDSIFGNNFNMEFGLHNATAPKGGQGLSTLTNLQAGGVWSGIEFAFASLLIDQGRYADGLKIVKAIHRRYLRAGQAWNHVECGGHYSRAMSSWCTLLAATGFKPNMPDKTLAIIPRITGDFHAPWITSSGFGTISRTGKTLNVLCKYGVLNFQKLLLSLSNPSVRIDKRLLSLQSSMKDGVTTLRFTQSVSINAGQILNIQ